MHRDIKGENVLVDLGREASQNENQIKLADFGASKRLSDHVAKGRTVVGTPYWMAPEVLNADDGYSFPADVWSAGCTVAEMITGKPPWPSKPNVPAAIFMIAGSTGPPTELPTEADGVPADCVDFMARCLTRDPAQRATADELLKHPWIAEVEEAQ
jgi:serine/threonine protein kinase